MCGVYELDVKWTLWLRCAIFLAMKGVENRKLLLLEDARSHPASRFT